MFNGVTLLVLVVSTNCILAGSHSGHSGGGSNPQYLPLNPTYVPPVDHK